MSRVNYRELGHISAQWDSTFEGILLCKQKVDSRRKRGVVFSEHWCRLKGNILVLCKTPDRRSTELEGVIFLERFTISHVSEAGISHAFRIDFDAGDSSLVFVARSETETNLWCGHLKAAPLTPILQRIYLIQSELRSVPDNDPLDLGQSALEFTSQSLDDEVLGTADTSGIELSLGFKDFDTIGCKHPTNIFVVVSSHSPSEPNGRRVGATEIIENCSSSTFLKTVYLRSNNASGTTSIDFEIFDVRDVKSNLYVRFGVAHTIVEKLLSASSLELRICDPVSGKPFAASPTGFSPVLTVEARNRRAEGLCSPKLTAECSGLEFITANLLSKRYVFHNVLGERMNVTEFMGESKICFDFPIEYLKFIIPREHLLYESLSRTGSSDPRLEGLRKERLISMKQTLEQYEASLRHLVDCSGSRFKPCWQRSNARYDFVPTNLHVNQIALTDLNGGVVSFHNVITVGAFCIGSRSHRSSGLFKMAANTALSSTSYPPSSLSITALGSQSPIASAVCLLESRPGGKASRLLYQGSRTLAMLRGDLVGLVQRLSARDQAELLSERIRRMLMTMQCIFSDNLLNDAQIDTHIKIESGALLQLLRELSVLDALGGSEASRALLESTADAEKRIELLGAIQKAGDLVIACLDSAWDRGAELLWNILLEDLLSINKPNNFGDPTLTESDLIAEAERVCLTNMAVNLDNALTALAVVYDSFAYRHHACLCQALTALLTALAAAIPHWNRTQWEQVAVCGLLAHFEGLLSCYGSELGMIEDWAWAIEHLADIRIVIRPSSSLGERTGDSEAVVHPVVQKGAEYACDSTDHTFSDFPIARMTDMHECELVIPWSAWTGAPTEIQSRGRVRLRIHSVSFLVGINEQQTIAEKFDRIGVQQAVNNRGLSSLELYFERYTKHYGAPPRSPSNHDVCDLIANIRHLLTSPPRSKPVELLEFASEATQALGGLRFTSCKSAKDRTSMSLTLEQIRWLKNAEGLNESYVHSALECVRRTGLRMENLFKNTGGRKYAFNRLQLLYFPRLYRPPLGTYGLGVTP